MIYSKNVTKINPLPKEFLPPPLGADCDTDEVSTIAMKSEYKKIIEYITEYDDPWYNMSVKDQLEQSHVDGSHTTVKTKRPKKPKLSEFDRNQAWQMEQYGEYEGGYPAVTQSHAANLERLSLQDKFILHDVKQKPKIGPWHNEYVFSKYTADGTALEEYNKVQCYKNVNEAVTLYEVDCAEEIIKKREDTANASSRGSSRSKKRSAKVSGALSGFLLCPFKQSLLHANRSSTACIVVLRSLKLAFTLYLRSPPITGGTHHRRPGCRPAAEGRHRQGDRENDQELAEDGGESDQEGEDQQECDRHQHELGRGL